MSIKERKQREKEALRNRILSVSMDIILASGVEGFSIRTLADRIDYSPRTVYLYFKNKDAILRELVDYQFGLTLKAMESGKGYYPDDPKRTLEESVRSHVRNGLDHPNGYRLIIHLLTSGGYEPGENEKALKKRVSDNLFGSGTYKEGEIESLMMILFSTIRGFTLELINSADRMSEGEIEKRIGDYTDFIQKGIFT